ncbi:hypothetical protein HJFPF1_04452 [Paramyrothecium foliicola]|nr:hypothetical protein HJFPF1_04452 [Paramyrothecium foliicola]
MGSEVPCLGVFLSLAILALNLMLQPTGRVCGFPHSARVYLRSSPVVCTVDSLTLLIDFSYKFFQTASITQAANKSIAWRYGDSSSDLQCPKVGSKALLLLRLMVFVLGTVFGALKIFFTKGLQWEQIAAGCYVGPLGVTEVIHYFAIVTSNELTTDSSTSASSSLRQTRKLIHSCEVTSGVLAVLLQLFCLTWVDLAEIPPDDNLVLRWAFGFIRLVTHLLACLVYAVSLEDVSDISWLTIRRRKMAATISMLLMFGVVDAFQIVDYRYTLRYLLVSLGISSIARFLTSLRFAEKCIMFYDAESDIALGRRPGRQVAHILSFDFLSRLLFFSAYWYARLYKSEFTFRPEWLELWDKTGQFAEHEIEPTTLSLATSAWQCRQHLLVAEQESNRPPKD